MPPSGIRVMQQNCVTRTEAPWLARFLGKLVLDILPAALASVIGGFLFTQYHFGLAAARPAAEQAAPASAEMMAMVRDEHALIVNYLKAQTAAEKRRDLAEDADTARAAAAARAAADAKLADALFASQAAAQQSAAPAVQAKAAAAHPKPPAALAAAPHAPLAIAQAGPTQNDAVAAGVAPGERVRARPGFASRQNARHQGPRRRCDAARRFGHRRNVRLGRRQHWRRDVRRVANSTRRRERASQGRDGVE